MGTCIGRQCGELPPALGAEGQADGNVYRLVRATQVLDEYAACFISGDYDARETTTGNDGEHIGIAQVEIPNGHTGWLLVEGEGRVLTQGGTTVADNLTTQNNGVLAVPQNNNQPDTVGISLFGSRSGGSTGCRVNRPFLDTR